MCLFESVYAKIFILDKLYSHHEKLTTHVKILFADFSSAFNLMHPHILANKTCQSLILETFTNCVVTFHACKRPHKSCRIDQATKGWLTICSTKRAFNWLLFESK